MILRRCAGPKLSPNQTRQMIDFAVWKPGSNAEAIAKRGLGVVGLTGMNPYLVSNRGLC